MGLVLDTSALVEWERASSRGAELAIPNDEQIALPAIVWAEALIGVRLAKTSVQAAQRRARLEAIRHLLEVETFTPAIAEHYADIYSELAKQGNLIPQNDIAVAATARQLGFGVLVGPNDEAHFRKIQGMHVHVVGNCL